MNDYSEIRARFEVETAGHEMQVLHDDGLYRHLHFRNAKDFAFWFDLITVPNALIFRGDGESFVFSRLSDMFAFFRSGVMADGSIRINPGYWDEKLTSERDAASRYSEDAFQRLTAEQLADAEQYFPGVTDAWAEHVGEAGDYNTEYQSEAERALYEFEFGESHTATCSCGERETFAKSLAARDWGIKHQRLAGQHKVTLGSTSGFTFQDIEPRELQGHYWWFLWACHAICWGIQRYDAAKATPAEAVA